MTVELERVGHVALLTLNRPERLNALNEAMWRGIDDALDKLEAELPRALVITGAGEKAFCAGMDINPDNPQIAALVTAVQQGDRGPCEALLRGLRKTVDRLVDLPIPVIAAINGLAYGGAAEIATRCDLRVVDPKAMIAFSEVRLGLMPDLGGGPALARLLGPGKAADLILTARKVGAEEALALGLANRISEAGGVKEAGIALGQAIADNGPRAVRSALKVIRCAADMPLDQALEFELNQAADLIASGECQHGITAVMSKQKPNFPAI